MVYATCAAIASFTSVCDPDAMFLRQAVEVTLIGLVAVPVTFVVPAAFVLRRAFEDDRRRMSMAARASKAGTASRGKAPSPRQKPPGKKRAAAPAPQRYASELYNG